MFGRHIGFGHSALASTWVALHPHPSSQCLLGTGALKTVAFVGKGNLKNNFINRLIESQNGLVGKGPLKCILFFPPDMGKATFHRLVQAPPNLALNIFRDEASISTFFHYYIFITAIS